MRDYSESKRKFKRTRISIRISYKAAGSDVFVVAMTDDVSEGGLRIRIREEFALGQMLLLKIELEDGGAPILALGKIAWQVKRPSKSVNTSDLFSIGVQFLQIEQADADRIFQFVFAREKREDTD